MSDRTGKLKKYLWWSFAVISGFIIFVLYFMLVGQGAKVERISWGVTFSVPQAEGLNLEWQKTFLSLLDDLGVRQFRLVAEWDRLEPKAGEYDFSSLDWQLSELEKRGGKAIVAIGMKVPRWPECHIPAWAKDMPKEKQQLEILSLLKQTVSHFSSRDAITIWQVENEPFLPFGTCPWLPDLTFLKKEIAVVKAADPSRQVMVTDSGELSLLFTAARLGDIVGTTLYRKVLNGQLNRYITCPFSSGYYARRVWLIKKFFGKEVQDVELQAEPWTERGILNTPLEETQKTLDLDQFKDNIEFARHAGHKQVYLWGAEWWHYMKEQNRPEFWDEAKLLFSETKY